MYTMCWCILFVAHRNEKDAMPDTKTYIVNRHIQAAFFVHALEDVLIIGKSFYNDQGHIIQLLFLKRINIIKNFIQYFAHG